MICKKCGRKYEDDMPNCLWCNAPNDNVSENPSVEPEAVTAESIPAESAFTQEEPENVQRGRSAIAWLKFVIIFSFIVIPFGEFSLAVFEPNMNLAKGEIPQAMDFAPLIVGLFYLFLFFILCLTILIALFKCCKWLYISIQTLRKFTSTTFSPIAAVFCTLIPWGNGIFDYFIFKDILARQEHALKSRNAKFTSVKPGLLKWILILAILSLITSFFYDLYKSTICKLLGLLLSLPACWLYIKTMKAMIENEKNLLTIQERDLLDRKVDEILKQREKS